MRVIVLVIAISTLIGCASNPVSGNEAGGIVMHGGINPANAFTLAQNHCQEFGKSARITNVTHQDYSGDPVLFECVTPGK